MHPGGTEKSKVNMAIDVIISTVGEGSRLHKVNAEINKSLLPYANKPIIHHIVEKIPVNLKIGILLGYRSQQVIDFLTFAFPEREFIFIYVDDWTSSKSGTKYSLLFAHELLCKSFWYFPCDGIYENVDFLSQEFLEDVFIVSEVSPNQAHHYLTFDLKNRRIVNQFFKSTTVTGNFAFTGVMKIIDKELFFSKLEVSKSNEFIAVIAQDSLVYTTKYWKDLGNSEMYEDAISEIEEFDFSKTDEYTYQLDNVIIKWWADPKIASLKLDKPRIKPEIFPKNVKVKNQFMSYAKSPGYTFYEKVNKDNFKDLLLWLQDKLWSSTKITIDKNLEKFYRDKTISRINLLGNKKLTQSYNPRIINGIEVQTWRYYYERINWGLLTQNSEPSFIHGDLQFDNIIYDQATDNFTLIDWRYDFSGLGSIGDLYYDFAKMLGGIYMNYHEIKQGNFGFSFDKDVVSLDVPSLPDSKDLIIILETCVQDLGLSIDKLHALVPLIFWNMAPLHKEPFSNLCWCLGIMHYEILHK
jgi:NDP-sugar pyrophosphorylase family protein